MMRTVDASIYARMGDTKPKRKVHRLSPTTSMAGRPVDRSCSSQECICRTMLLKIVSHEEIVSDEAGRSGERWADARNVRSALAVRRRRKSPNARGVLLALTTTAILSCSTACAFLNPDRYSRADIHRATIPPVVVNTDYRDLVLEPETRKKSTRKTTALDRTFPIRIEVSGPSPAPRKDIEKGPKPFVVGNRATALTQGLSPEELRLLEEKSAPTGSSLGTEPQQGPTCRVVALADSKLPTSHSELPPSILRKPHILRSLDDIYHAMAHDETRLLKYMDTSSSKGRDDDAPPVYDEKEEKELVSLTRQSLEDAGFQLLSRRDLDLCEALNADYLLRLSIVPDVSELDPTIAKEFYPGRFDSDGKPFFNENELLFDGRVLVYRRGYSQKVSKGRLLLPKFDYFQASLVQRSAAWFKGKMDNVEEAVSIGAGKLYRRASIWAIRSMHSLVNRISNKRAAKILKASIPSQSTLKNMTTSAMAPGKFFKLSRYGGSKRRFVGTPNPMGALTPFIICQASDGSYCQPCPMAREKKLAGLNGLQVNGDPYYNCDNLVQGLLRCPYDVGTLGPDLKRPPMQLLERVTISNLINVFSEEGRRSLFRTLFSKSELVEPTYEEVVVVWRPLPKEPQQKPVIAPPKIVYELADMFDVEGLPKPPPKKVKPARSPLEIRTFDGVPMANLPAVLPKTKLVFRPADAFAFDLASITSLLLLIGSWRFDSLRLDLLAIVSVSLWLLRTILRYSNKLARYDLLVKKFLTSKISHRNAGALKYITTEAGSQRATRAALVHTWLSRKLDTNTRSLLVRDGSQHVNELVNSDTEIPINIDAALNDLEDLQLVKRTGEKVEVVRESYMIMKALKSTWDTIFDGRMSLRALAGRREASSGGPVSDNM